MSIVSEFMTAVKPTTEPSATVAGHSVDTDYKRTRRLGGWGNPKRELYLELFAKPLNAAASLIRGIT